MTVLAVLLVGAFIFWAIGKGYLSPSPKLLAKQGRKLAGFGALILAAIFAIRGRFDMGLAAGGVAAWLLGYDNLREAIDRWTGQPPRDVAMPRFVTQTLDMRFDPKTGESDGVLKVGPFAGQALSALGDAELIAVARYCAQSDPGALGLLETYLDRRLPGWREHLDIDAHARPGVQPQAGVMTAQEAYEILGLQPGASREEVGQAYRALMKKLHPDQGGTAYFATRINLARDTLLALNR